MTTSCKRDTEHKQLKVYRKTHDFARTQVQLGADQDKKT